MSTTRTVELAELFARLDRDPNERLSINTRAGGRFRSRVVTVDQAAAAITDPAADWWYGTAVLHPRVTTGRGTAADVVGVRELFADLDIKPGGMPDEDTARQVIYTLSDMLGASPVAVVHSGHGLQPHWAIERSDATDWPDDSDPRWSRAVALSRRWGRLVAAVAERHGGSVDTVSDLARVLRVPGTTNCKGDPVPVTVTWVPGASVSLDRLADTLDEYGIPERPDDTDTVGPVVAPPAEWRHGERTCDYVARMVAGWSTDQPEARHPWLVAQAVRLACAHRLGCITGDDHEAARRHLADRFTELVATTGEPREVQLGEIDEAMAWGERKAAGFTEDQARRELGNHTHTVRDNFDWVGPTGHNGSNGAAPESDQRDVSMTDELRAALIDTAAVRSLTPPEPLVGSWLVRDSLAMLYGPSGGGKTFLTLDWALHVATGSHWNGNPVHTGPVVYVIAEGASGIGRRIDAWTSHHQLWQLDRYQPIRWLPRAVNLADTVETAAFAAVVAELDPVLVIFDTLARCTVGAEENSARDMGLVVANLDRVRRATGACVLAVHHSGKDGTNGARGSSALRAAMDTELELTATDDRQALRVTKQKDGPEPEPLQLARIASGESCVLLPAARVHNTDDLPAGVAATLAALCEVQVPGGVSTNVWRMAVDVPERTFYRHRTRLLTAGLVRNVGSDRQPRYMPADLGEHDDASCPD